MALGAAAGLLLGVLVTLVAVRFALDDGSTGSAPDPLDAQTSARDTLADASPDDASTDASRALADETPDAPVPVERLRIRVVRFPDGVPLPGARVSVRAHSRSLVVDAAVSSQGRMGLVLPPATRLVDIAASAPGHDDVSVTLDVERDGADVLVELPPLTGWVGRVVMPTGEGVGGVDVTAHRFWPPRPSLLTTRHDGSHVFTSTEGRVPTQVTASTNPAGYYYVPPFETDNVVDLVLSAAGTSLGSDVLRVPLPTLDGSLPDLVLRSVDPLHVQAVDSYGRPVPGTSLAVDRGPGLRREAEEVHTIGAEGRVALRRHRGLIAVAASHPRRDVIDVRVDGLEPRVLDGWIEVEPGARQLLVVLDEPLVLRGLLLDAVSDAPVPHAAVTLHVDGPDGVVSAVDTVLSRADGTFELRAPASARFGASTVAVDGPLHAPLDAFAPLGQDVDAPRVPYRLAPLSGGWRVTARAELPAGALRVRAWIGPREARHEDVDVLPTEPLDPRFARVRDVVLGAHEEFVLRALSPGDEPLALLAEVSGGDSAPPRFAVWGPGSIEAAAARPIAFEPAPRTEVEITLKGLLPGRSHFLSHATWHPWLDDVTPLTHWITEDRDGERTFDLLVSGSAYTYLELRLDRGPVSAVLARMQQWLDPVRDDQRAFVFTVPPTRRVEGGVYGYGADDWPHTALAFLGDPVLQDRLDAVGESDWCVRPSGDGRYRIEHLPEGDYLLVLYRPVGDEGVEVLAQRALSVTADLYHVDIHPERADSGRRVLVR